MDFYRWWQHSNWPQLRITNEQTNFMQSFMNNKKLAINEHFFRIFGEWLVIQTARKILDIHILRVSENVMFNYTDSYSKFIVIVFAENM